MTLEKRTAAHSIILAWRIPWTEEPGGYSPWGHKESDTTKDKHKDPTIWKQQKKKNAFRGNVQNDWSIVFKKRQKKTEELFQIKRD